jgi:HSP20 family protein
MARNALTPYGGSDPFLSLHREVNRLFDDMWRGGAAEARSGGQEGAMLSTRMNVCETDNEFRLTAELPGVREQDIDLTVNDDVLTIRGEKRFEQERGGEKENYHFMERAYGTFQRSLRLPYSVNPDEVHADFRDGVLTVTIPKSAQQQKSRRIQIGAGAGQETMPSGADEKGRKAPPAGGEADQPVAH